MQAIVSNDLTTKQTDTRKASTRRPWLAASLFAATMSLGACAEIADESVDAEEIAASTQALVGGNASNAHPEVAQIWTKNGTYTCSATLVRSHWLITAGHCFWAGTGTDTGGGSVLFTRSDGNAITDVRWTEARSLVIDGASDVAVDIALVRLNRDVGTNEIVPAALHNGRVNSGTTVDVVGYGCGGFKKTWTGTYPTPSQLCPGDSGGGLFVNGRLALVNQGTNNGDVYADLPHHRNEIEAMIRQLDGGFEIDVDRSGADYRSFSTGSLGTCRLTCAQDTQCRAYSFSSVDSLCWLKNGVRELGFNDNRVSGLPDRFVNGFDTPGNDLSNFATTNLAHCANECARNASCKAFTLNRGNGRCYLKTAVGSWTANSNCTSGIRRAFETATDHAGGDLSNFATTSATTCSDTCSTTVGCVAWTLNSGRCYLKEYLTDGIAANASTKTNFRKGYDFFQDSVGADITSIVVSNWRPELCQAYCRANSSCRAWTMNRGNARCYLKSAIQSANTPSAGTVTGTSHLDFF